MEHSHAADKQTEMENHWTDTEEHKIATPDPVYNIDRGNNCKQEQKDLPDPFYRRFVSAGCQNKHRNEH